jgi:hypothetical protein
VETVQKKENKYCQLKKKKGGKRKFKKINKKGLPIVWPFVGMVIWSFIDLLPIF